MKDEKSYVETERMREQSELGRKEEKIVNYVVTSVVDKYFCNIILILFRLYLIRVRCYNYNISKQLD